MANDNIVEAGRRTQFGQPDGADPSAVSKDRDNVATSVRSAMRRMIVHLPSGDKMDKDAFAGAFGKGRKFSECDVAQRFAIIRAMQAMQNYKAMDGFIDHVDGKLVTKNVEAKVDSYADLVLAADKMQREAKENAEKV